MRLRTLKPGFFSNDELAEIAPLGRLLFAGLWCMADRGGRLEDRPKKIKASVLPYDDCKVDTLLDALARRGFIVRYKHEGNAYIQITNFSKHQNPHIKEAESTIPAPDEHSVNTVLAPKEAVTSIPSIGDLSLGSGDLELGSDTPPTPSRGDERASALAHEFDIFWTAYPRKENKPGALRAWKKLRPDALLAKCIHTGLVAWKGSDQWQRGIVPHAQTWLNARQWEDEPFAAVRAPNGHAEPVTFQQQIAINNRRNGEQFLAAVERHQNRGQQDVPDGDEQARRLLPHGG